MCYFRILIGLIVTVCWNDFLSYSQEPCKFTVSGNLYCDTAYIYRVQDSIRYEYYIDFSSTMMLDSVEIFERIKNKELRVYFPSYTLEGLLITTDEYRLKQRVLTDFFTKKSIDSLGSIQIELILNQREFVLYQLSGETLNKMGHYHRKRYGKLDCINACSTISENCEIGVKKKPKKRSNAQ